MGENQNLDEGNPSNTKVIINQLLFGLVAVSGAISSGIILGFSAVSLPQLTDAANAIYLNTEQASWFASLTSIVSPIGCLLCGPLLDRFGRKTCLLLLNAPCLLSWILLTSVIADNPNYVLQLYFGRIFSGITVGLASIPGTVYLAEIASTNKLRSMLVTWTSIGISLGILVVYILGAIFRNNWRLVAGICAIVPTVATLLTYLFLPESPVWLISRNETDKALVSLKLVRGVSLKDATPPRIQGEFETMLARTTEKVDVVEDKEQTNMNYMTMMSSTEVKAQKQIQNTNFFSSLRSFRRPEAFKPLLIMVGLFFFQQFSGIYVVIFYAVNILTKAGVSIDAYLATVLLGLMQFLAGIAVCFALKRFGRRPMCITSGIGMTLSLIGLGLYLQFDAEFTWFPLIAMLTFVIFGMLGFHTLPWALLGEMYPLDVKGLAAGITTCFGYVFSFLALQLYPSLFYITNSDTGIFYFYGVVSFLATFFVIVFLPETHKKSLMEIQEGFSKKTLLSRQYAQSTSSRRE